MPKVESDIIATPAWVFQAPKGTTLPADTVAADGEWPAGWVNLGFTTEPLKIAYKFDEFEIEVQQTMAAIRRTREKEELMLESVLAEHSAPNLALAMDGVATATAAGASQPGKETVTLGGNPTLTEKMYGFEGFYTDEDAATFPIRGFIWRATVAEGSEISYGKGEVAGIPLKVKALADTTKARGQQLFKLDRMLEPATP